MRNLNQDENKKISFEETIKEFEDNFIREKRHELYRVVLESVEKPLIEKVLERTFGNQLKAAKILGINRNTLRAKIKKLKIDVKKWKL